MSIRMTSLHIRFGLAIFWCPLISIFYACVRACVCACACVCARVSVCACARARVCERACVRASAYVCACVRSRARVCMRVCARARVCDVREQARMPTKLTRLVLILIFVLWVLR